VSFGSKWEESFIVTRQLYALGFRMKKEGPGGQAGLVTISLENVRRHS
jgi:hypothetical protein